MQRVASFTLLVVFLLFGVPLQARRAVVGGMSRGFAPRSGHLGDGVLFPHRGVRGLFPRHSHFRSLNKGSVFVPLWFGDPFAYDDQFPYIEPVVNAAVPPVIVRQEEARSSPPTLGATPILIEVPGHSDAASAKPLLPAIFILTTGEHVETRRYLLTADNLYSPSTARRARSRLLTLDMKATLAANHERGIDLRVPADENEITLAF